MAYTQTWLITGTSRGIGLELTRQLLAEPSCIVVATCRNPEEASALQALNAGAKGTLHVVALDVASEQSIRDALALVQRALGERGLDVIFNNAAINEGPDVAFEFDPQVALRTFQTNVVGPAFIAQTFLPLLEKGQRKVIANMSSGLASIGLECGPNWTTYSISKAALNMLTYKQKAQRPDITSVVIDPGWVKTDMGGDGATLEPKDSVAGVLQVVNGLTQKDSGKFYKYTGEELPW